MRKVGCSSDVYVFKNNDLKDDDVQLVSLEFVNQVMNSYASIRDGIGFLRS